MRIIERRRGYFRGTHKGHEIEIERDRRNPEFGFYITVRAASGIFAYDGYAPEGVTTIAEAKREAIRGAQLDV